MSEDACDDALGVFSYKTIRINLTLIEHFLVPGAALNASMA